VVKFAGCQLLLKPTPNTLTIIYTTLFTLTETWIVFFEKIKRGSSFRMKKLAPGSDFPKTKIMP